MNDFRNLAIAAHVDAGKTTLAERILYHTGCIRTLGNVNEGSAFLDHDDMEKARGITIFSEFASVTWKNTKINLVDTPGHYDFYSDLARVLPVVDAMVIVVSAVEGVQQYTAAIWEMLSERKIPVLFFINKMDRVGADLEKTMQEIKAQLTAEAVCFHSTDQVEENFWRIDDLLLGQTYMWNTDGSSSSIPLDDGRQRNAFLESLIEKDDLLLEKYLNEELRETGFLEERVRTMICQRTICPVLIGSAVRGIGTEQLLDYIVQFFPRPQNLESQQLLGNAFKIKHEKNVGKKAYVRIFAGTVQTRDIIRQADGEDEKVNQIWTACGEKYQIAEALPAGDIGIISGLKQLKAGDYFGRSVNQDCRERIHIKPYLTTRINLKNKDRLPALLQAVQILNDEEPSLCYQWDEQSKEIHISVMGTIQMEVLCTLFQARFGLEIELEQPTVTYYETICQRSKGFCHFEPKKHYAEVEVEIEPNKRGNGNRYISEISTDELPVQYQNAIEKSITEALACGELIGFPLTDITVKLIAGKHHLDHTHGGDFRIATIRAVRQAIEKNISILLEPMVDFLITTSHDHVGKIIADIHKMSGTFYDPVTYHDKVQITGTLPAATSMDYPLTLAGESGGEANITFKYAGYQKCHNQDEIIELFMLSTEDEKNKQDILYNSVSLFRAQRKMKKVKD